ncbi:MAG: recombination mediator RecR [Deltaproteobacteria bacterium]
MNSYAPPIKRLITAFTGFPGIGEKTAARMVNHIVQISEENAVAMAKCIIDVKTEIKLCSICFNLAEGELCEICKGKATRDEHSICVVEDTDTLITIEESGAYTGLYHVLHGAVSPLDGIGPDNLKIKELLTRIANNNNIVEIIVATNPTVSGEATALLLTHLLNDRNIKISRLALGIPVGVDIRYTDKMTIGKALEFRRSF